MNSATPDHTLAALCRAAHALQALETRGVTTDELRAALAHHAHCLRQYQYAAHHAYGPEATAP